MKVKFWREWLSDLEITTDNFNEYFFDVRWNRPKAGQVMAKFSAVAIFADGPEKRDLIKLLKIDKSHQAAMVMKKIHCAREPDCYVICRQMCEDILAGMADDEVAAKEYEFVLEAFYYTNREFVPDDPHWTLIQVVKLSQNEDGDYKFDIQL